MYRYRYMYLFLSSHSKQLLCYRYLFTVGIPRSTGTVLKSYK